MRHYAYHCPTCTCLTTRAVNAVQVAGDPKAPFHSLVIDAERAWTELMAEDRAAGRRTWRPYHTAGAA